MEPVHNFIVLGSILVFYHENFQINLHQHITQISFSHYWGPTLWFMCTPDTYWCDTLSWYWSVMCQIWISLSDVFHRLYPYLFYFLNSWIFWILSSIRIGFKGRIGLTLLSYYFVLINKRCWYPSLFQLYVPKYFVYENKLL